MNERNYFFDELRSRRFDLTAAGLAAFLGVAALVGLGLALAVFVLAAFLSSVRSDLAFFSFGVAGTTSS